MLVVLAESTVSWIDLFAKGGPTALMMAAFFAGYKRIWMYRHQHDEIVALLRQEVNRLQEERERERVRGDKWEGMALRLMETGREAIAITAKAVEKTGQPHE